MFFTPKWLKAAIAVTPQVRAVFAPVLEKYGAETVSLLRDPYLGGFFCGTCAYFTTVQHQYQLPGEEMGTLYAHVAGEVFGSKASTAFATLSGLPSDRQEQMNLGVRNAIKFLSIQFGTAAADWRDPDVSAASADVVEGRCAPYEAGIVDRHTGMKLALLENLFMKRVVSKLGE